MKNIGIAVLLLTFALCSAEVEEKGRDPDIDLTALELIVKYGYPAESHTVMTADGYALGVHRIPHGRSETGRARGSKPVVFVQHGLTASSSCWLLNGPDDSLAYMLADAGYDVWLGNTRGNKYSRLRTPEHDPEQNDFWKFSWHEGGVYDLPAVIDYILEKTGQEKIFYVGHSMGTTMFYVMASERPEYNDKIQAMVSLAPVAYMSNIRSIMIRLVAPVSNQFGWLMNLMGMYEFLPQSDLYKELGQALCNEEAVFKDLCQNVAFLIMGPDTRHINVSRIPLYLNNIPQGISTRMIVHFGQEFTADKFRRFDHGLIGNMFSYGAIAPPEYDLTKITAPVILFYGDHDDFADPIDVFRLQEKVKNSRLQKVPLEGFTHFDFIIHSNVRQVVYEPVIELLNKYSSK